MSNYTKSTDFAAKDTLITGNPAKVIKGVDINTEFAAIETAIDTKYDSATLGASGGSALVGYLPAGTGAVATTVQTNLRESVSIKGFGAVCNGVTDDTAAINLAIAYLQTIVSPSALGGDLKIRGTPLISSTITVPWGVNLVFDGSHSNAPATPPTSYFIKKSTMTTTAVLLSENSRMTGGGVVYQAGATGDGVTINGNSVRCVNVSVIGVGKGTVSGNGFRIGKDSGFNSNFWYLESCVAAGLSGHGFYFNDHTGSPPDANAGTAQNCFANSNGGNGFEVDNAWINTFLSCTAENNTGIGINMNNHAWSNFIIGGDYEANPGGQMVFQIGSAYNTLLQSATESSTNVIDNGFNNRRLDRYIAKTFTFTPALYASGNASKNITAVSVTGTTVTATSVAHGYTNGKTAYITGMANENLNGAFVVSNVTANTFDFTYRTDRSVTLPTSVATAATAIICADCSSAVGRYRYTDGMIEFDMQLTTTATNFAGGTVLVVLPVTTQNIGALNSSGFISYCTGITYTGELILPISHAGATRTISLQHNKGSGLTPANLPVSNVAAASTIVISGRYYVQQAA